MIGIEIGSGWVKFAQVGKRGAEKLVTVPLPDKMIQEGKIVSYEAMASFLASSIKEAELKGKCALAIPIGAAYVRRLNMPLMTVEQLKVNLPYEFKDYLEQDKARFAFDYMVLNVDEKQDGMGSMDILGAAISKEALVEYKRMFKLAGLQLEVIAPTECAISNLIKHKEGENSTKEYCVVDIGHHSTKVYIYTGTAFEILRVIDRGGEYIDRYIAEEREIDEFVARGHKETNFEGALDLDTVHDVYESLSLEIMRALNFYKFNNHNSELEEIYFCGGTSNIQRLKEMVCTSTEMKEGNIKSLMGIDERSNIDEKAIAASLIAAGIAI